MINKLNTVATITLKLAAATFLAATVCVGTAYYSDNQPNELPPLSCKTNTTNFQHWLGDGRIVSIFEAPIQNEYGYTLCMGTAEVEVDVYQQWSGWITKTIDGPVGMAELD